MVSNIPLFVFVILGYLLVAAAAALLSKLTRTSEVSRWKSLRLVLFRVPFIDHSRLPRLHLKLMLLFFGLFLFFNLNFLAGTISTEKCTVPTDEIVDSVSKLIRTSKTLAFNDGESELVRTAPAGSFLAKLSGKKNLVLNSSNDLIRMKTNGISNYVIFTNAIIVVFLTNRLSEHARKIGSVAFIKSTDYYERLSVFQMRRSLDEERKRFINGR